MNRIKNKRLIVAGIITFIVDIFLELMVESIIGPVFFSQAFTEWYQGIEVQNWVFTNQFLDLSIGLLNCMLLIWLYAALRPMFGVGAKTALITSLFWFIFVSAFAINLANIGYFSMTIALLESIYMLIELPIALLVGAYIYEKE